MSEHLDADSTSPTSAESDPSRSNETDDGCCDGGCCDGSDAGTVTRRRLSSGIVTSGLALGVSGCLGLEDEFGTSTPTFTPPPTYQPETSDTPTSPTSNRPTETETSTVATAPPSTATETAGPSPFVTLLDADGAPVTTDRLAFGDWLRVTPERTTDSLPKVLNLVRYPEDQYEAPTDFDALAAGYAAYSKICTHQGCEVNGRAGHNMVCPCHDGKYDALAGGTVIEGPPPEALAQFALSVRGDETLAVDTAANSNGLLSLGGLE